jgi:hypothetical protein
MYMAARHEFGVPTALQIDALRARVGDVRVALICDPEVAGGFCAGHIAGMWQLRSVDGYYGLGVPDRLRKLPWGDAIGLHTISFTGAENLPWPVLSLLNAGKVLVVSNELFKNYSIDGSPADVNRIQIIDNLQPVVPRAFLAKSGEPVADSVEASRRIFGGSRAVDVRERSYVEGLTAATTYAAEGEVNIVGSGDQLQFDVSSSTGLRLLIVNELFFPGWRAFVDGSEVPILPANVVMRAVALSPSAKNVTMTYEPFVRTSRAVYLHLFGIFFFFLCLFGFARAKAGALD